MQHVIHYREIPVETVNWRYAHAAYVLSTDRGFTLSYMANGAVHSVEPGCVACGRALSLFPRECDHCGRHLQSHEMKNLKELGNVRLGDPVLRNLQTIYGWFVAIGQEGVRGSLMCELLSDLEEFAATVVYPKVPPLIFPASLTLEEYLATIDSPVEEV